MTFKEFLQLESMPLQTCNTAGVSISQMNPVTLGARAANKELKDHMPTRVMRQTGKTSVARALQGMLGIGRPALPTPEQGPTLRSNLDRKPRKFNPEPRFKKVKSPMGLLGK